MAFSEELRKRLQSELQTRGSADLIGVNGRQSNSNASYARQSAASVERNKEPIIFNLPTTHHRVLAMFLAYTQGDHEAIQIATALQYHQCVTFARTYQTKHFLTLLTEKVLPNVIERDPVGAWAYACENEDIDLVKQCFIRMGDHWCITVEPESRSASWSVFSTGVYSAETPVQCADAFAPKVGLDKFRAFLSACDNALDWAAENGKAHDAQAAQDGTVSKTKLFVESQTGYIVVEGHEMWERIYEETVANDAFNAADKDIVVWADDLDEQTRKTVLRDATADSADGNRSLRNSSPEGQIVHSSLRAQSLSAQYSDNDPLATRLVFAAELSPTSPLRHANTPLAPTPLRNAGKHAEGVEDSASSTGEAQDLRNVNLNQTPMQGSSTGPFAPSSKNQRPAYGTAPAGLFASSSSELDPDRVMEDTDAADPTAL
ncbi:hypothetical protein QFC19_008025 [Naganishia cerealis]|uniref:Uncharacterized protein n=1 Tax=Naganishia cerealis TaxID=610337 RepID=A0ACC2V509_9TREE|nr:hypothetical protein QFC19_008025 [Naganishia cerealis]